MSKVKKALLGVLTFWPFVYMIAFFVFFFSFAIQASGKTHGPPGPMFFAIFPVHILTMFIILGLVVYYVIHLVKLPDITSERRMIWILLLILGNMIALPFYWYFFILKERDPLATITPAPQGKRVVRRQKKKKSS